MSFKDLEKLRGEVEDLVKLVQKGDHDAFSKVYDIFVDHIYRYVYYRVNPFDVEDVVENVFLKVWENINKYKQREKKSFASWIFRISHNVVVDYYRAQRDQNIDELKIDIPATKREHNPIKVTEDVFDQNMLKKALKNLKKSYQEVLIYKFINDFSNTEISEILKKSEGSLRILQHRALKALRRELDDLRINY